MTNQTTTAGIMMMSAIVRDRSTAALGRINQDWLLDGPEQLLYEFVTAHVRHYGSVPTIETVMQQGMMVVSVTEPFSYYANQVSNRQAFNHAREISGQLTEALVTQNVGRLTEIYDDGRRFMSSQAINQPDVDIGTVGDEVLAGLRANQMSIGANSVMTGYGPIDDDLNGLRAGDLLFIAARMKQGKTWLLLQMTINAWLSGKSVLIVSMEMSPREILDRMIAMVAGFNPSLMRQNRISTYLINRVSSTIVSFADLPPIHFVKGNFSKTPDDIRRAVDALSPDLLVVDGTYLLHPSEKNNRLARHEAMGIVIGEIKAIGEDHQIASLNTLQINRQGAGSARRGRRVNDDGLEPENIAGTDDFARVATCGLAMGNIRGQPNLKRVKNILTRNGTGDADIIINFQFNPPNFSYAGDYVDDMDTGNGINDLDPETRAAMA